MEEVEVVGGEDLEVVFDLQEALVLVRQIEAGRLHHGESTMLLICKFLK